MHTPPPLSGTAPILAYFGGYAPAALLARLLARQEETDRAIAAAHAALTDGDTAGALATLAVVVAEGRPASVIALTLIANTVGAPTGLAHADRAPHAVKTAHTR